MFWKVAGFNATAQCHNCRQTFVLPKTYFCRQHAEPGINQYGENRRFYKCCNSYDDRFSLAPGASGCVSTRHEFSNIDSEVQRLMQRKHFVVESFLKEGQKDPIIEAMGSKQTSSTRVDYFKDATADEKAYFQPIR